VSPAFFQENDVMIENVCAPRPPCQWAADLLRIARAVYMVDKFARRAEAPDGWTRTLELTVSVTDSDRWAPRTSELTALLNALTSDDWQVHIVGGARAVHWQPTLDAPSWRAERVSLFSGGLDSTAYAASVARKGGGPLLLVGHYRGDEKALQEKVHRRIVAGGMRSVHLAQYQQTPALPAHLKGVRGLGGESTTRSRGLLFLAAAIYAAAAHGVAQVTMPENGQLAVNPPLAPSRVGACSTRSVHPWTLYLLNRLIAGVDGDVTVTNPLLQLTKGEVCLLALESGLTAELLGTTESCGRSLDSYGRAGPNCGYCFACLVRRSGLFHALGDDPTGYDEDPWDRVPDAQQTQTDDLITLLHWLRADFTVRDLVADLPLPDGVSPAVLVDVIQRGRQELSAFLSARIPAGSPYRTGLAASGS